LMYCLAMTVQRASLRARPKTSSLNPRAAMRVLTARRRSFHG
jgi:hypothetical protein